MKRGLNDYRVEGDVAYLALTNRAGEVVAETMMDAADLPMLEAHGRRWHLRSIKGKYPLSYVQQSAPGTSLHRFLLNPASPLVVDHINGNGLDNRRSNLRVAEVRQNLMNQRPRRSGQYKGVFLRTDKPLTKPYRAYIGLNGKTKVLGHFITAEEAARCYDDAARQYFGEFCHLNFPEFAEPPPRLRSTTPLLLTLERPA